MIWSILLFILGLVFAALGAVVLVTLIGGGDGEGGVAFWAIVSVFVGICLMVAAFDECSAYTPTEEDIAKVQKNYIECYDNTIALEDYTVSSEVFFEKKGLLGGKITISGDITKANEFYSGNVVLEMPGNEYNYTYSSPYGKIDTWASLHNEDKRIFLPFNVANLGKGIIQPLSEEIIKTSTPTAADLKTITFSVTNEQAYELYGTIIDYFKKAAEEYINVSDLTFSEGTITVYMEDNLIKDYKVELSGKAKAGTISCGFSCSIK